MRLDATISCMLEVNEIIANQAEVWASLSVALLPAVLMVCDIIAWENNDRINLSNISIFFVATWNIVHKHPCHVNMITQHLGAPSCTRTYMHTYK